MKKDMPRLITLSVAAACLPAVILTLAGCGGGLRPGGPARSTEITRGVFPPDAEPSGKTYGQWSAAWWQWALSIATSQNPMLDETGANAGVGQSGPVYFLAGTMGASVERTCTVPAGKAILFPIITSFGCVTAPGETVESLTATNKDWIDHVTELEVNVDGVALTNLGSFRFVAPVFMISFDAVDPLYDIAPGPYTTVSDGYWIMLEPLSAGQHTIYFRAKIVCPAPTPGGEQVFETSVTYNLTIQ